MSRHADIVTGVGCGTIAALRHVGEQATGVEPIVIQCPMLSVEDMLGYAVPGEPRAVPEWLQRARQHIANGHRPWVIMCDYDRAQDLVRKHFEHIRALEDDILFVWASHRVQSGPYR